MRISNNRRKFSKKTVSRVMKNFILILPILVMLAGLQACTDSISVGNEFLDKPPSQGFDEDSVFASATRAERFLIHAYRSLPYGPGEVSGPYDKRKVQYDMLASLTDINNSYLENGGANKSYYSPLGIPYSDHQTKFNYGGSGAWDGIREAHIFLENVDRVPDMGEDKRNQLKAEARMIIALQYTEMIRHFGGLPWIERAFEPNDELERSRQTIEATVDSTVAIIDKAIPDLPFTVNQPSTEAGRFTQAGAMGIKARLLLFAASPLFNDDQPYLDGEAASEQMVWYGGYQSELWQRAADAAKDLIDEVEQSGAYHLLDTGNPREDFRNGYYQRTSPEVLISTRVRYRSPNGAGNCQFSCNYYYGGVINGGAGATTDNYVRMFPMADGTPIDENGSGYDPQNPYENRDPRLYETVLVNGDDYQGRTVELWIGGREREQQGTRATASGYRMRKFVLDGESAFGTVVHYPYLRLPEIYLSYAEALNEINGGPTAEAYEYVNRVRNRVDLGDLPTGLSQEEFREAVLRERALEFGYEEVRWYDLIRWKREEDFTKTLHGMNIEQDGGGSFTYEQFDLPSRQWQNNWSPQWYLSAFPQNEIDKGYGLVQNPGWE